LVLKVNGTFDDRTWCAVDRFKAHFFAGTRASEVGLNNNADGKVTRIVADRIKMVLAGLPADVTSLPASMPSSMPASAPTPGPSTSNH
jgi:hypothetical protein